MSRIGRKPIELPSQVKVSVQAERIKVEGPKGKLEYSLPSGISVEVKERQIVVKKLEERKELNSFMGLARALINNMVEGVSKGFKKELEIVGVGYKAQMRADKLVLQIGFSHPVEISPPPDLKVSVPQPTRIVVEGIDKQKVGEFSAQLRRIMPPEPYKGKGIRYSGELIRKKLGKAMAR